MARFPLLRALEKSIYAISRKMMYQQRRGYTTEMAKRFEELRDLHPLLVEQLSQQELIEMTDIQSKCLPSLLSSDSFTKPCIINAETGSGKTLCFLLPVLQLLTKLMKERECSTIPVPTSLVLVPTSHLAHQIQDVFHSLALPGLGSSLSYKGSKLSIKSDSHLLIATPSSLANFSLSKLLKDVKVLCVDEADVLLSGGESRVTWSVLEEMRQLYRKELKNLSTAKGASDCRGEPVQREALCLSTVHRQIIFTAATLPSRGSQSVQAKLLRWLPKSTLHFDTFQTHQVIPLAEMRFVDVDTTNKETDSTIKFSQLTKDLVNLKGNDLMSDTSSAVSEEDINLPKVLVFANTVTAAEDTFSYLERFAEEQPGVAWWRGRVRRLHKQSYVSPEEKEKTLQDFKAGGCRVLVSTDLASRGLDLPNITAVIQVDFPSNSADFLHRAGRTARAGKAGTVISYVGEGDRDLADEVREVVQDKRKTFNSIFSRNKMLRRKLNRKKQRRHAMSHDNLDLPSSAAGLIEA